MDTNTHRTATAPLATAPLAAEQIKEWARLAMYPCGLTFTVAARTAVPAMAAALQAVLDTCDEAEEKGTAALHYADMRQQGIATIGMARRIRHAVTDALGVES